MIIAENADRYRFAVITVKQGARGAGRSVNESKVKCANIIRGSEVIARAPKTIASEVGNESTKNRTRGASEIYTGGNWLRAVSDKAVKIFEVNNLRIGNFMDIRGKRRVGLQMQAHHTRCKQSLRFHTGFSFSGRGGSSASSHRV